MLNIKDIVNNKKQEPKEVGEIRNLIKTTFKDIIFKEDTHQYFLPQPDGSMKELNCVSNVTHQFVPHVDWDEVCRNKAIKLGIPYEELKEQWHYNNIKATNSGTHTHEYGESYFYFIQNQLDNILPSFKRQLQDGYFLPNCPKEEAVEKFFEWFFYQNGLYPVLAEAQVYTNTYSGTFDLLTYYQHPTDESKNGLIVMDFKTNGDLYSDYNQVNGNTLLEPFTDIINENIGIYTLQLSAYQIPLEDLGLKIIGRRVIWLKPDGNYELIKVDDVTKKLRKVIL